jgi:polar amino acid transport system substrate-binding protein
MSSHKATKLTICGLLAVSLIALTAYAGSSKAGQSQLRLDKIQHDGVVRIGLNLNLPPFGTQKDGKNEGFDVDLANIIANQMKVKLKIVPEIASARIPNLLTNKIDISLENFTITPQRALKINFTDPLFASATACLAKQGSNIKSIKDLANKSVGVSKGSTGAKALREEVPSISILPYDTPTAAALAVQSGRADAACDDSTTMSYQAGLHDSLVMITGTLTNVQLQGIGVAKGHDDLLRWLNVLVHHLNNSGKTADLYKKWFVVKPPLPIPTFYGNNQ